MTTEIKMLSKQVEQLEFWKKQLGEPAKIRLTEEVYKGQKGVECDMHWRTKHGIVNVDIFQSYEDEKEFWDISKTSPKVFAIVRLGYPDKFEGEIPATAQTWKGHGYQGGHVSQSYWDKGQETREAFGLLVDGYKVVDTTEYGQVSRYYPELKYWKE
jgi:hypothetical protein